MRALRAATQTGGAYIQVTDEAILEAMRELAREAGIFAEPAGSTSYAGLIKAAVEELVKPEDRIVVLNTGNGLKDVKAAMQAAGEPTVIEPTLAALKQVVR